MANFKIGDVVYDEVNYPKKQGKVENIDKDDDETPIGVRYGVQFQWYEVDGAIDGVKCLSHTPYTIEFKGFSQVRPLTDEQKVCIKGDGTFEYGKKIIEYLLGLDGKSVSKLYGYLETYYFMKDNLYITHSDKLPEGYKEISLKEVEPICYVGKKIVFDDCTELIIRQDKEHIETSENIFEIQNIHNYKIID